MDDILIEKIEDAGRVVECESPFEIRDKESGDGAVGHAAQAIVDGIFIDIALDTARSNTERLRIELRTMSISLYAIIKEAGGSITVMDKSLVSAPVDSKIFIEPDPSNDSKRYHIIME